MDEINQNEFTNVMAYIYITSYETATDIRFLKSKCVSHVLNVSPNKKDKATLDSMARANIANHDLLCEDLIEYTFNERYLSIKDVCERSFKLISDVVKCKQNIVVHCGTGESTSAAVILYYMLRYAYATTVPKCAIFALLLRELQKKRGCVQLNYGFIEFLEDFEKSRGNMCRSLSARRNTELDREIKKTLVTNITQMRQESAVKYGEPTGKNNKLY